jgi:hypothetical protein
MTKPVPSAFGRSATQILYFDCMDEPQKSVYVETTIPSYATAKTDCFHLAVCVEAKIDYLLSWNCSHLGIEAYAKIYEYNGKKGVLIELEREKSNEVQS